ncbi:uncharacterized protein y4hQ [Caerostris darwini]|uniref:Uncharacterized protein y4hQ n=1 Tax=Caerostris darwini TaxID=1538125 RepID=A0AAV4QMG2_9ARAC|nr:uncharacterized protein y4hQ [Caerostris darwini]
MAEASAPNIFQFKISLKCIKPRIWRRIQVPSDYTFQQLHFAIQDAMGWQSRFYNYHLHSFELRVPRSGMKIEIGIDHEFSPSECISEETAYINEYFLIPKAKATYLYDFGDNWEHGVVLEKILPAVSGDKYPKCIGGKRACPPEDCGGYDGYDEHIEIIGSRRHPEYKDHMEWLESKPVGTDPEEFDPAAVVFCGGKSPEN